MNQIQNDHYQRYMVAFMSYLHNVRYDSDTIFQQGDLATITPDDVRRWMCFKAFGTDEPSMDSRPTHCRANTLEVLKKAISWYMPNRIAEWNSISKVGNPTKSKEVNDVIKFVKKAEVRRIGKPSSTKRPLTQEEFCLVLSIFF
jgi:hypothetical protein